MSTRRQVWATLAALLQRLENNLDKLPAAPDIQGVQEEVRRLGKAQFKANTLAEDQAARWQESLSALQESQALHEQLLESLTSRQKSAANRETLTAILPALDSLDLAIASGPQYLAARDKATANPHLSPNQARLVSPADRAMLAAWLDGLRLVRERLLAVLETGDVTTIPAVGRPFDPFLHHAVEIVAKKPEYVDGLKPEQITPGTIVRQERPGYRSPEGVLRYADVVVYKPAG
jgi:molecular chaperone GrpE (heat shock protein)